MLSPQDGNFSRQGANRSPDRIPSTRTKERTCRSQTASCNKYDQTHRWAESLQALGSTVFGDSSKRNATLQIHGTMRNQAYQEIFYLENYQDVIPSTRRGCNELRTNAPAFGPIVEGEALFPNMAAHRSAPSWQHLIVSHRKLRHLEPAVEV